MGAGKPTRSRAMPGRILVSVACLLMATVSALAQSKTVVCKDGRRISGTVTLGEGIYTVVTKVASVTIPASEVETVVVEGGAREEYQQRRVQIDPNSAEEHVKLGRWALDQQLLEQAREEFQSAVALQPRHEMAALLLQLVERKLQRQQTGSQSRPASSTSRPAAEETIEDGWLVSEEDINRIRLAETGAESLRTFVDFRGDVIDRFIQSQRSSKDFQERRFRRMRPVEKLAYIVRNLDPNNPSLVDDIVVRSDPKSLDEFRRSVWPGILQTCGAANCHGGPSPVGGWKVFRAKVREERIDYTNFVILDGLTGADGKARMIDRGNPDKSLLLQYGLAYDRAEMKHPVKLRQPMFSVPTAAAYRRLRDWIAALKNPHPNYRLDYVPPMGMKLSYSTTGQNRSQERGDPAHED